MNYSCWYSPKKKSQTIISGISANIKKMANNLSDIRLWFAAEKKNNTPDAYFIYCYKAVPIMSCLPFALWNPNYDLFIIIEVFSWGFDSYAIFRRSWTGSLLFGCPFKQKTGQFIYFSYLNQWAKFSILLWRLIQSYFQCSIYYFGINCNDKGLFRFKCYWILRRKSFFQPFHGSPKFYNRKFISVGRNPGERKPIETNRFGNWFVSNEPHIWWKVTQFHWQADKLWTMRLFIFGYCTKKWILEIFRTYSMANNQNPGKTLDPK